MAARVTAARMAAFRALLAMERSRNAHCDELLRAPAIESLSQADRNLTTALVMGVLRWQLALDKVLAGYLKKKSSLDDAVAIALRLGAWQLLGMDRIPPHAALSESVELTKASGHSHASGLVNAVLRRVAGCFVDRSRSGGCTSDVDDGAMEQAVWSCCCSCHCCLRSASASNDGASRRIG